MVKKTKEQALETRQRILDAAADVFGREGVAGASLEKIAEQAGVTRGAVYWHFKNKNDIFEAIHEQMHSSTMDELLQQLESNHPDPLGQLEQLTIDWLVSVARDPMKRLIMSVFHIKCEYSGEMSGILDKMNDRKSECLDLFIGFFEKAQQKALLSVQLDAETLTLAFLCYVNGIKGEYLRDPDRFDLEKQAPLLVPLFFAGLKK